MLRGTGIQKCCEVLGYKMSASESEKAEISIKNVKELHFLEE